MSAVALQKSVASEFPATASSREGVLARYRHLREISKRHHSEAMSYLSADAILHHARRMGLTVGRTLVVNGDEELGFAFDLAIYTAPPGRSRAIDRFGRFARFAQGADEELVLEAMQQALFSVFSVERRHKTAGLVVSDLFRGNELWLVDEGLEIAVPDGSLIAARVFAPDGFSMTAGVVVPFDLKLLEDVLYAVPPLRRKSLPDIAADWRFAEVIYRISAAHAGLRIGT